MAEPTQPGTFKHLVRIANVDLPGEKQIRWALTKIKGVGIHFADAACILAHVPKMMKTGTISDEQIARLNSIVTDPIKAGLPHWMLNRRKDYETGDDKHLITGNLIFATDNDIKLMKKIRSYKGLRHTKGLPVRGQRTRSNFRKSKGKVVGVVKKKVAPAAGDKKDDKSKKEDKGGKKEAKK
ncbi:30S ribosomal protein S13 [Candidatus Woesearchaeota archaeon]|nr:30S ribosomal protein S13 [Candidatus Woesearchaeota archaeon]